MIEQAVHLLCLLAARQDLHRVWGRFDHQRPADGASQLLIVIGMAVVAVAALVIWSLVARRKPRHFVSNSRTRLFRELCRAHDLRLSNRRLLKRLAAAQGLETPSLLFVEPKYFEAAQLSADLQPLAGDVQRLRAQLFANTRR